MAASLLRRRRNYILVSVEVKVLAVSFTEVPDAGASTFRLMSFDSPFVPTLQHVKMRLNSRRNFCPLSEYNKKLIAWFVYIRLETIVRHSRQMALPCASFGGSQLFSRINVTAMGPVRMMKENVTKSSMVVICCSVPF